MRCAAHTLHHEDSGGSCQQAAFNSSTLQNPRAAHAEEHCDITGMRAKRPTTVSQHVSVWFVKSDLWASRIQSVNARCHEEQREVTTHLPLTYCSGLCDLALSS